MDAETKTEIESAESVADAIRMVKGFEIHDVDTGIYEPDYYRILRKWSVGHRRYCAEFTGHGLLLRITKDVL